MTLQQELETFTVRGKRIPQRMHKEITQYVNLGIIPEDKFLQGIIIKDLPTLMDYADDENLWLIPVYYSFFYNCVPSPAWGNKAAMENWAKKHLMPASSGGRNAINDDGTIL